MPITIPSQVSVSPVYTDAQFLDNLGNPLAGGLLFTYEGGTNSIDQTTFTDSTGTVPNTNPIVLDSSGRMGTELWLADGFEYNLVLTMPDGTTVLSTYDHVAGVMPTPAGGGIGTVLWNPLTVVPTYIVGNEFSVEGLFTIEFSVGNRIRYQFQDLSYGYGTVTVVTYDGTSTFVTFVQDSTNFNNTAINVSWSAAVVTDSIVDAGAVTYTASIPYTGNNVGAKIQGIETSITTHAKSYDAILTAPNTYTVTTGLAYTSYTGMVIDVKFSADNSGASTINVDGISTISLVQKDNTGANQDPVIKADWTSRIQYDGASMVLNDQLPYTPPATPPPSFQVTMGTVTPYSGTFTLVLGPSGNAHIAVANNVHALYGNFGTGTFKLYANGTQIATAVGEFFEWDSRQGGANPTLLAAYSGTAGDTITFQVVYAGPGQAEISNWTCITA